VVARLQAELPTTAKLENAPHDLRRLSDYRLQPDIRIRCSPTSSGKIATYDIKPRLNRLNGGCYGGSFREARVPEFQVTPQPARLLAAGVTVQDYFGCRSPH